MLDELNMLEDLAETTELEAARRRGNPLRSEAHGLGVHWG